MNKKHYIQPEIEEVVPESDPSQLSDEELKTLSDLLFKATKKIHQTTETKSEIKMKTRHVEGHLFAFLSYIGVTTDELDMLHKGVIQNG